MLQMELLLLLQGVQSQVDNSKHIALHLLGQGLHSLFGSLGIGQQALVSSPCLDFFS